MCFLFSPIVKQQLIAKKNLTLPNYICCCDKERDNKAFNGEEF